MRLSKDLYIFIFFILVLLWQLGAIDVTIMEARNFVTAYEMVEDGSYFIPTLNGEYRLQKPPLPTWITAAFGVIFGFEDLFYLRLPAALMGLLALAFAILIYRRFSEKGSDWTPVGYVLCSSFYFFFAARSGTWDIFAQAFMLAGIYFYDGIFRKARTSALSSALFFGLFAAASFMSKGPVALYALFLPFLTAYHVLYRDEMEFNKRTVSALIVGAALAILLSVIWPIYIYFSEAGQDALDIVAKETSNWSSYNVRPFYYYWSFPTQSGVWTLLGFISIIAFVVKRKAIKLKSSTSFYFFWTMAVFVLLSVIPEKKSRYLLPILFPLTLLVCDLVAQSKKLNLDLLIKIGIWVTSAVIMIAGVVVLFGLTPEVQDFDNRFMGGLLLIIAAGLAIFDSMKKELPFALKRIGSAVFILVIMFMADISELMNSKTAVRSFSEVRLNRQYDDISFYSTVDVRPEITWYLKEKTPKLDLSEFEEMNGTIGVFNFDGIKEEWPDEMWEKWNLISEERFDQNSAKSLKKPNIALRRYLAVVKRK